MHPSTQPRDTYVDAHRQASVVFLYGCPAIVTSLLPTISVGPRSCHHRLSCLGRQQPSIHSPVWLLDSHFSIKFVSTLARKTHTVHQKIFLRHQSFTTNHSTPDHTACLPWQCLRQNKNSKTSRL